MRSSLTVCAALALSVSAASAEGCPTAKDEIATDRPDVANSSLVVPAGSLQVENGINASSQGTAHGYDGTNTRLRLGIAPCLEFLVDLPTYFGSFQRVNRTGFTDLTPAIKWQISPAPGKVDLSAVFGMALPTGTKSVAGPGVQPYLQAPWSVELGGGWAVNGMVTEFFRPSDPGDTLITEATFSIEKKVGEHADLFVEYVGDYPNHTKPALLLNTGGGFRLTPLEQLDFHVAFGLTRAAPSTIFGLGYSWRRDSLF